MISFNFGDVVLVPFPFTNQTTTKKRPAVVVSSAAYNQVHNDVIIMAITTQSKIGNFGEAFIVNWCEAGLLKPSVIKPIITTVEKSLIIRLLGQLELQDQKVLGNVLQTIFQIIELGRHKDG